MSRMMMFAFLAIVAFCLSQAPLIAQVVEHTTTTTTTLKRPVVRFVDLSEWIVDPEMQQLPPSDTLDYLVVLPFTHQFIGIFDNQITFIVEGRDFNDEFLIGIILDGSLRMVLSSKNIRNVGDRFFFEFPMRMLGSLNTGEHALTLRINPMDRQMTRDSSNEHTVTFTVK